MSILRRRRIIAALGTLSLFPWPSHLAQSTAKGFNFLVVGNFLALGQFQRLKHFLHVFEAFSEALHNLVDLFYRFLKRRWGRRP